MRRKITLVALLLACICILGAAQPGTSFKSGSAIVSKSTPSPKLTANDSIYINSSKAILTNYKTDLLYSMKVLKDFESKNITGMDALSATTSLYILTSINSNALSMLKPPAEYKKYHGYLKNAVANLMLMEWNLAKLYETNNVRYLNMSQAEANLSVSYYNETMKELGNITT